MAFHALAPLSPQLILAATGEMWASMQAVLHATPASRQQRRPAATSPAAATRQDELALVRPEAAISTTLPEYMASVPLSALRPRQPSLAAASMPFAASSILGALPKGTLRYASPLSRPFASLTPASRSFSATARLGPFPLRAPPALAAVGFAQQRSLFASSWGQAASRNMLGHMEVTANSNPASATAQNAFYQALLRANMPEILVERYNTGRYATNPATEEAYLKALERIGAAETASLGTMAGKSHGGAPHTAGMSSEQLQAIGQAISAKHRGGNVSISSRQGTGDRQSPLYVVVDESIGSTIFRWVRFLLVFALVGYCLLVLFTLVVDATGVLKKIGGVQSAEAKPELQTTRFSDVHGCDEAKEELQELVEFLKAPDRFSNLGGKLPKGVLLVGPPGTGKTLLARAVAGEAGVPFFYMSGSEFDEVYVGVGAKRVRELFSAARGKSPAIIFIDELDAVGSKRKERDAAYAKQTLNQLLTELDGFEQNSGVIVIGATNFPQSLDNALTRPGRFDRNINVALPDVRGRMAILKHHMRNIRIAPDVDASEIARGCPGFSGAELESIVNQAAIRASKNKSKQVTLDDMVWATDKIRMGAERRSAVIQQKDKVMTAYHEGGHALVAMLTDGCDPLYKATIMPRGHALGITSTLPEMDKVSLTKREMMAKIDMFMGGKVAEELIYGGENVTTGASSDIQQATQMAYAMVTQAGMSDRLGNIDLASDYGRLSTQTKQLIESEVRRLVEEGKARAEKLLTANRDGLERLANGLVQYETLNRVEMEKLVRGEGLGDKAKADSAVPIKEPELGGGRQGVILPEPGMPLPPPLVGAGEPSPGPGPAGGGQGQGGQRPGLAGSSS